MAGGQVVGVIDDLPTCQQLIDRIAQESPLLVDGLVARLKGELGYPCKVIATGGLAVLNWLYGWFVLPETLAQDKRLPLHVDACIGGWVLPYAARLGRAVPPWTFAVEGEAIEVVGRVAYLHTPFGLGTSKLGEKFDRGIGVANTARNWNTVLKLSEIAAEVAKATK